MPPGGASSARQARQLAPTNHGNCDAEMADGSSSIAFSRPGLVAIAPALAHLPLFRLGQNDIREQIGKGIKGSFIEI